MCIFSGTLQGAGGIGGLLLWKNDRGSFLYLYDANGNVGQLVNAVTGALAARYEYDPFGNALVADGPEAQNNVYRFSTKPYDVETGLYAYIFRYYSAKLGRWWTKDPIEEEGGVNLYGFVGNDPVNAFDPSGLQLKKVVSYCGETQCGLFEVISFEVAPYPLNAGGGALLSLIFTGTNCLCRDLDFRWIQTVYEDTIPPEGRIVPYVDSNTFPYYYSDQDLAIQRYINKQHRIAYLRYLDIPVDPVKFLSIVPSTTVKFRTCAVCASENNRELLCITWGFKYYKNETTFHVDLYGVDVDMIFSDNTENTWSVIYQ